MKCADFTFLKSVRFENTKHIHRKVKCAHLVPEPGSRWRRCLVPGSKKKSLQKNSDIEMHRQVYHTDVVPELARMWSMSLVARCKK